MEGILNVITYFMMVITTRFSSKTETVGWRLLQNSIVSSAPVIKKRNKLWYAFRVNTV